MHLYMVRSYETKCMIIVKGKLTTISPLSQETGLSAFVEILVI